VASADRFNLDNPAVPLVNWMLIASRGSRRAPSVFHCHGDTEHEQCEHVLLRLLQEPVEQRLGLRGKRAFNAA
jgi:hypothetical protein